MIYKNTSNKARIAVVRMIKRVVRPGETVYMGPRDVDRTRDNMKFFSQVKGTEKVKRSFAKNTEVVKQKKENPAESDVSQYDTPPETKVMEETYKEEVDTYDKHQEDYIEENKTEDEEVSSKESK